MKHIQKHIIEHLEEVASRYETLHDFRDYVLGYAKGFSEHKDFESGIFIFDNYEQIFNEVKGAVK